MEDELWDIYDGNKRPTGRTMRRNDWNMRPGDYHLTVLAVVRHPDGRFLITKRAMTKSWAPGCWETPGGGVLSGEDSGSAVLRELREETGLDVSGWAGGYLFTYRRDNPREKDNYFVDVYRFTGDFDGSDIRLQAEETDEWMLADAGQIERLAKKNAFLHYDSIKNAFSMD